MRVDTAGRLGLAVIRHGAPVEGLQSGEECILQWHVHLEAFKAGRPSMRKFCTSQPAALAIRACSALAHLVCFLQQQLLSAWTIFWTFTAGALLAASHGLEWSILHLQQQQLLSALNAIWSCTTGVLLAASDGLERSIFRRSVVLVYEHGNRSGARGVILSQPLGPTDLRFNPAATPGGLPALSHFLGGPVGMPGAPLLFHCAAPCLT